MRYKDYFACVEFDDEAAVFHGEVINTRDVITFQGTSVAELQEEFRRSVDDYLAFCVERGEEPDKPFSGKFLVRVSNESHRNIFLAAHRAGMSLNAWVAETLDRVATATVGIAGEEMPNATANEFRAAFSELKQLLAQVKSVVQERQLIGIANEAPFIHSYVVSADSRVVGTKDFRKVVVTQIQPTHEKKAATSAGTIRLIN